MTNETNEMKVQIPATREAAIDAIAQLDAERWGEAEREASRSMHRAYTYGLALNTLAARAELEGRPFAELRAAADTALTDADWRALRMGG